MWVADGYTFLCTSNLDGTKRSCGVSDEWQILRLFSNFNDTAYLVHIDVFIANEVEKNGE